MDAFALDLTRSAVTLRTRAKGLLSALAHDLELSGSFARGSVKRDGDRWEGELAVAPSALKVVGPIKGGATVRDGLPAWEVREIERRIVEEVFGGVSEIVVRVRGTTSSPEIDVVAKREGRAKVKVGLRDDGGSIAVNATGAVSMKSVGLAEVKGPLGAFTVKDDVEVSADIVLTPA